MNVWPCVRFVLFYFVLISLCFLNEANNLSQVFRGNFLSLQIYFTIVYKRARIEKVTMKKRELHPCTVKIFLLVALNSLITSDVQCFFMLLLLLLFHV